MFQTKLNPTIIKLLFIFILLLSLSGLINSPVALVSGFLFTLLLGNPFSKYSGKAVGWLLKIAVVGLGFGMNVTSAIDAGKNGFMLTVFSIVLTLLLGFLLGRLLKIDKKTTHLISSGTAICGGSAIAATAPIIQAKEKHISIALGIVFILNSIALLIFPVLGHVFKLTQQEFGLWAAIAIHDTSSVVGAAHAFGDEALQIATTVKLARALWIIPLSLVTALLFKGKGRNISIPWFILLFILAIIANTYLPIPTEVSFGIKSISKALLVATLFLIGTGLSIEKLKAAGWKPLLLGLILWIVISVGSLIVILQMS